MKPAVYNICAKENTNFKLQLNWKDATGTTVNLTGYAAQLVVRYQPDSPAATLDCSAANGLIVLAGTPYNIVVSVDKATMAALPAGEYVYDLVLTGGGEDYPLFTGKFTITNNTVLP